MKKLALLWIISAILGVAGNCLAIESGAGPKTLHSAGSEGASDKPQSSASGDLGSGLGRYDASEPITINSDKLVADNTLGKVVFTGKVVARQGEMVIYAEELVVHISSGKKGGDARDIDRVECTGDVRIVHGPRVATGQKASFLRREGKIVLSGSPKVIQGADFVEGDEITVFLNEERSVVSSQKGSRVNATFNPGGDKK